MTASAHATPRTMPTTILASPLPTTTMRKTGVIFRRVLYKRFAILNIAVAVPDPTEISSNTASKEPIPLTETETELYSKAADLDTTDPDEGKCVLNQFVEWTIHIPFHDNHGIVQSAQFGSNGSSRDTTNIIKSLGQSSSAAHPHPDLESNHTPLDTNASLKRITNSHDRDNSKILGLTVKNDDDDINPTNSIGVSNHATATNHSSEAQPLSLLSSSDIRKKCKLGDLIVVRGTQCSKHQPQTEPLTNGDKYGDYHHLCCKPQHQHDSIHILHMRYWDGKTCQLLKQKFYPHTKNLNSNSHSNGSTANKGVTIHKQTQQANKTRNHIQKTKGPKQQHFPSVPAATDKIDSTLQQPHQPRNRSDDEDGKNNNSNFDNQDTRHSGGSREEKLLRGKVIANFLIEIIQRSQSHSSTLSNKLSLVDDSEPYETEQIQTNNNDTNAAVQFLNQGSGVMDVAGGAGHVSLALSLLGVKATVIDPRLSVGKLPRRDRKLLRKAIRKNAAAISYDSQQHQQQQQPATNDTVSLSSAVSQPALIPQPPPIPFSTVQAYFGSRIDGSDSDFNGGSSMSSIPIICQPVGDTAANTNGSASAHAAANVTDNISTNDNTSTEQHLTQLLRDCSAIIALHPDEATDAVVDYAIQHRKPFLIVPCCVFSRLFPHRRLLSPLPNNVQNNTPESRSGGVGVVSTYKDLVEYIRVKDPSIGKCTLPFVGANIALWSTFSADAI